MQRLETRNQNPRPTTQDTRPKIKGPGFGLPLADGLQSPSIYKDTRAVKIEPHTVREFMQRLLRVCAELLALPLKYTEGGVRRNIIYGPNAKINLTSEQSDYFVKKFQNAGLSEEDARSVLARVCARFEEVQTIQKMGPYSQPINILLQATACVYRYFNQSLIPHLIHRLAEKGKMIRYGGVQGSLLPKECRVTITAADVDKVDKSRPHTWKLHEDKAYEVRLNTLTALALGGYHLRFAAARYVFSDEREVQQVLNAIPEDLKNIMQDVVQKHVKSIT